MNPADETGVSKKGLAALLLGIVGVGILAWRCGLPPRDLHERLFERLPDNFPPKWMFLNISAIREQNDQILRILGAETEETRRAGASETGAAIA